MATKVENLYSSEGPYLKGQRFYLWLRDPKHLLDAAVYQAAHGTPEQGAMLSIAAAQLIKRIEPNTRFQVRLGAVLLSVKIAADGRCYVTAATHGH